MRVRHALRPFAITVLISTSLLGMGSAAAASGVTGGGEGTGAGQMVGLGVASASTSVPLCGIKWRFEYTLYEPNGPIKWGWHSTVYCSGTTAVALSTRASLWLGSQRAGAAPIATCQHCASETLHGFKSIASNGAGSWYEKTADVFTVPKIGTDTAKGIIVWSFSNGEGNCTEVNADEVQCATTSDAVVVP
jgi:hypothetical protein